MAIRTAKGGLLIGRNPVLNHDPEALIPEIDSNEAALTRFYEQIDNKANELIAMGIDPSAIGHVLRATADQIDAPTTHRFGFPVVKSELPQDRRDEVSRHLVEVNRRLERFKKG
jgi:hypothetical protein